MKLIEFYEGERKLNAYELDSKSLIPRASDSIFIEGNNGRALYRVKSVLFDYVDGKVKCSVAFLAKK